MIWTAVFVVAAMLPIVAGPSYYVTVLINLLIRLPFTLSLSYVIGRLGLFTMAHSAFLGIGAYVAAILAQRYGVNPWLTLPASVAASAAVAAFIGFAVLRLKGLFLAVSTLAFALFIEVLVRQSEITGGAYGITDIPPLTIAGTPIRGILFYELALAALALTVILFWNIKNSPFGRAGTAAQDNEHAAAAAGINVARVRIAGFTLSAAVAGLSGWLYAFYHLTVNPFLFSLDLTFVALFMVLIGGLGSMVGVAIGTTLLSLGPELIGFATTQQVLASGVLVLIVVLLAPRGIGGLINEFNSRKAWRKDGDVRSSVTPAA
ncbi:MAG: branched-chain amino acid ABC transporter permease [Rhizobiales bacterium]|nr:branched-chain amino acid ABC transporter permease [Hyphomicrobiales bacterium]